MITVLRAQGFHITIYVDDHPPAHVHVLGDGHAKINLMGSDGLPELVRTDDMKNADVRKAMRIVVENQHILLARWREIHG